MANEILNQISESCHTFGFASDFEAVPELNISDGYVNKRVIVYDTDTLAFKRMWGVCAKRISISMEFTKMRKPLLGFAALLIPPAFSSMPAHAQNNPLPSGAILNLSGTRIPGGANGTFLQYTVDFTGGMHSD